MTNRSELEERDGFVRGYHGIPDESKLRQMSFVELASLLGSCEKDSPKFIVIDRELKKRLLKDQSEINLRNVVIGACVGGLFGLSGVFIGAQLKDSSSTQQIAPFATVQQNGNGNLAIKPPASDIAPSALPVSQPTANPASMQGIAKASAHTPSRQ